MLDLKKQEVWFITGSQHLYGEETLRQVADDSKKIAQALSRCKALPVKVVFKPTLITPDAITELCIKANSSTSCIGLICWMHTFSPAKMWIAGLKVLQKPFVHLHTQFNRDIPWDSIDMDFMNLNQSAHGGREFGFICTRLRKNRKVVVGHWQDAAVQNKLGVWVRAAMAYHDSQGAKIARFGDNMREVAVTEGDKVEAQKCFGYSVNGYGVGDLVAAVNQISEARVDRLVKDYDAQYDVVKAGRDGGKKRESVREAARIELGLRAFLEAGDFVGFTTTFENLCGLKQLPGLAVQRLMADGYGFGAEGDWKTAALVRAMKVMGHGLPGGSSFMEDYTYHLEPGNQKVLGAHMLEICASIASQKPTLEVHPLGIGGKDDPVRLVFNVDQGPALNASLIDMGNRFRMVVNTVDVVNPDANLPKLPVARVVWVPRPNLEIGAGAWIHTGAAHHSGFSMALTAEHMEDFSDMFNLEYIEINETTTITDVKNQLRWNEMYYMLAKGL
ncbi:MAG: L-arabinose isomerase [Phycisphaeraceae bacterium]|nr:L-arabinose isomerase [Phycisphaeraceae bacterium]